MEDKGVIITFYSYKGGVGRTMALANVAWLLAEKYNYNILLVDWDLEAPGLHKYFGIKNREIDGGLIDLFYEYKSLFREENTEENDEDIEELVKAEKYIKRINNDFSAGSISILPAGRVDKDYTEKVYNLNWENLYKYWHGYGFVEYLKEKLKKQFDYILIDSRTGMSDIGGICTLQMPDVVVLLFSLNEQNISGTKMIAENIVNKSLEYTKTEFPPKIILMPSRVDKFDEMGIKDKWERRASECFKEYLPRGEDPLSYIKKYSIPYTSYFGFGEKLAVVEYPEDDPAISLDRLTKMIIEASSVEDYKKIEKFFHERKYINKIQNYEDFLKAYDKLLKTDSYSSIAFSENGETYLRSGRYEKASEILNRILNLNHVLLKADPENKIYKLELSTTLNNLGSLLFDTGRIEDAKKMYENALQIREEVLIDDPENVSSLSLVATTQNNLGSLFLDTGQVFEANNRYEKALEIYEKILKNDPENVLYQSDLGMIFLNFGNLLSNIGQIEEAKKLYEKSLMIREKLLQSDSENVEYQSYIGTTLNNLGNLLSNMGRIEEAKQKYEKALDMRQKLLNNDPENVAYQSYVGTTLNNLGNLLSNMGFIEEAKRNYEKALEIYEKLLKTDPENVVYQSDVAMTLNNLGSLLKNMGRIEEAKQRYEKALDMRQKLLETDPENVAYQSYVGTTFNDLGNLLSNMGRIEEAKQRYEKALEVRQKLLETDPENVAYQSYVGTTFNDLGNLLSNMGRIEEAKQRYEKALEVRQKLLETDPENVAYQSYVGTTFNDLGNLLSNMGRIEEAKQRYEKALEMRQKLLETDPENVAYQSYVGTTLNNLGNLLSNMGLIEEAKQRYEKSLEVYTEPMQYLTTGKKSNSIIRLIELNTEQAKKETNSYRQIKYLEEAYQLCKRNQEFFSKYGLEHEKKLVMEAGLSAYLDYVIKGVREEKNSKKRAEGYEKAIKAIEKMGEIGDDEEVAKIASSAVCYLEGRKLVNEALVSEQPNLELIKQAINQFKDAKETYKKANVCYYIYSGLFKILEYVEVFEEGNGSKAKEMIKQVIEILPEKIDPGVRAAFKEIAKIFDENDLKSRKKHLEEFDGKIRAIDYKALENLFWHVQKKLKDYIEEPFSPNLIYSNWKLRIIFDAEKIKGKLTIKTGNIILFDRALSKEEIKDNKIEIDYLERKYVPSGNDVIIFEIPNQKPVVRDIDYSETISKNKKARILLHDCCNDVFIGRDLKIAVVQLRYDLYGEDYAVKILESEAYKRKIMAILEAVKGEADLIVFPEFSIPFDYLEDIQEYANETGIIIFAGTHYIMGENLEKYEKLFASDFTEEDLLKNICPIVIPNSKIIHNEKMFGAKEEREIFFHKGMNQGKLNHTFKLRDDLTLGVLIGFDCLNDELRHRIISTCDVILVPQINPNPERFYKAVKYDVYNSTLDNEKTFIMANGVFSIEDEKRILGGSTGIISTLCNWEKDGICSILEGNEQFVLLTSKNTYFNPVRDTQTGQIPLCTRIVPILEENEIINKFSSSKELTRLIRAINICTTREELVKSLTESNEILKKYSPVMYKNTQNISNLTFEKIKEICRMIFIPVN